MARTVHAHGRPGDVLVALSTSGRSGNVLAASVAAHAIGMTVLALTGRRPNPLAEFADDALCVDGPTPIVQEVHNVLFSGKSCRHAVGDLMERDAKEEKNPA